MEEDLFELLETFKEDLSNPSDSVHSFDFDFRVEEEFFECFEGESSHSSDTVHSFDFDFDFGLKEDNLEVLETLVEDLSHSSDAVHSFNFNFELKNSFLNYLNLLRETYHITLTQYILLISILE